MKKLFSVALLCSLLFPCFALAQSGGFSPAANAIMIQGKRVATPSLGYIYYNGTSFIFQTPTVYNPASVAITGGTIGSAVTGTTQSVGDNSTKLSTTAYTDAKVSDTAYDATTWDGVLGIAPSKNAVRDYLETRIPAGTDGTYGVIIPNNTTRTPAASTNELYPEANIWKVNQNGTESSVAIGPTAGQVSFTGPTQARAFALPDAAATVLTSNAAVSVAQGGTGAATIANAQLGLGIGSEVGPTTTNTATTTVDCGTVTSGDRILLFTHANVIGTGISFAAVTIDISAGNATVTILPSALTPLPYYTTLTNYQGSTSSLIQVTGSGTLTLRQTISSDGTGLTYANNSIVGYFLKKQ